MTEKLKQNIAYVFCAGLGFFQFILLAIPYLASFYSYDLGQWGGKGSESDGISGYKVMDLWDGGFGGVMSSLIQILVLLVGLALLALGVCGLLKAFGVFEKFPDELGTLKTKKIASLSLWGYAALQVLLLIFLIIVCAANTESEKSGEYFSKAGIRLNAGIFLTLIFSAGAAVGTFLLEKKWADIASGPSVSYVCAQCGKKARAADKFCNACGGKIEERVTERAEYACTKCGKPATEKDKFCNDCGGAVAKKEPPAVDLQEMLKDMTEQAEKEQTAVEA